MDPEMCAESCVHVSHSFGFPHQTQSSTRLAEHPCLDLPSQQGCLLLHLEAAILEKHHETKKVWQKVFWGLFVMFNMTLVTYSSLCQLQKLLSGGKKNQKTLRQATFSINDKQNNYSQTKLKATGKKIEA